MSFEGNSVVMNPIDNESNDEVAMTNKRGNVTQWSVLSSYNLKRE
jgi:hypothetical protein